MEWWLKKKIYKNAWETRVGIMKQTISEFKQYVLNYLRSILTDILKGIAIEIMLVHTFSSLETYEYQVNWRWLLQTIRNLAMKSSSGTRFSINLCLTLRNT